MQSREIGAPVAFMDAGSAINTGARRTGISGRDLRLDYASVTAEDIGENVSGSQVYDHNSNGNWALAVDKKGAMGSATKWVTGKIDEAGCSGTAVTIRLDQEESIIAVVQGHMCRFRITTHIETLRTGHEVLSRSLPVFSRAVAACGRN